MTGSGSWARSGLSGIEWPLSFYAALAGMLAVFPVSFAGPISLTRFGIGRVPRFPNRLLSTDRMILAAPGAIAGLLLDTATRGWCETRFLAGLAQRTPE